MLPQIIGIILLAIYVLGIWKFLSGFAHTNFTRNMITRVILALLWPVLLPLNPSYRSNFFKALKGS